MVRSLAQMVIYLGADQIATPLTCVGLGGYAAKLTFAILAPILLVSLLLLGSTCKALCESCSESGRQGEQRFSWEKVAEGAAPLTLRLLFLAYPFVTSIAFEAWVCDEFEEGAWLRADVSIKCGVGMAGHGSPAHASAISLAALGILIYPVGIMVGFGGLLYAARKAIIDERPTRLSNALQFLHRECVAHPPPRQSRHCPPKRSLRRPAPQIILISSTRTPPATPLGDEPSCPLSAPASR